MILWATLPDKNYAAYSCAAAQAGCGTVVYRKPDGTEVEVSSVSTNDPFCSDFKWEDKILLGEVAEWVRAGRKEDLGGEGPAAHQYDMELEPPIRFVFKKDQENYQKIKKITDSFRYENDRYRIPN